MLGYVIVQRENYDDSYNSSCDFTSRVLTPVLDLLSSIKLYSSRLYIHTYIIFYRLFAYSVELFFWNCGGSIAHTYNYELARLKLELKKTLVSLTGDRFIGIHC